MIDVDEYFEMEPGQNFNQQEMFVWYQVAAKVDLGHLSISLAF